MVSRMELTYSEIENILFMKYSDSSTTGNTLEPGIFEVSEINIMLKSVRSHEVNLIIKIDDIRLRSNLTTKKTYRFTKKSFFYTRLGFNQTHSGPLGDIEGFVQLIPNTYKSDKPINITGVDEILLKRNFIDGSLVDVIREPILYNFVLDKPPGQKLCNEPRDKLFKKIKKSVLSHITFCLEDDDHKSVDFNGEMMSFSCQLI